MTTPRGRDELNNRADESPRPAGCVCRWECLGGDRWVRYHADNCRAHAPKYRLGRMIRPGLDKEYDD